jgi:hypothetical protein
MVEETRAKCWGISTKLPTAEYAAITTEEKRNAALSIGKMNGAPLLALLWDTC